MVNFHRPHSFIIIIILCALTSVGDDGSSSSHPHFQFAYVRAATTAANRPYGVCNTPLPESVSIVQFRVEQWHKKKTLK